MIRPYHSDIIHHALTGLPPVHIFMIFSAMAVSFPAGSPGLRGKHKEICDLYNNYRGRYMDISIVPMTRELMHGMYKGFQFDPDIFDDMELYEKNKNYIYDEKKVDFLFDMRSSEENSHAFAVMLGGEVIVEVGLRHADPEKGECELSVHLKIDQAAHENGALINRDEPLTDERRG